MNAPPADTRRARRRAVPHPLPVQDLMTGQDIGLLGNISETGLLLISETPLVEDALYQLRFRLDSPGGEYAIDIGAHLLWTSDANAPGQHWAGFRFLAISQAHLVALQHWIGAR